ncbi:MULTISPECIES: virulence factor SrfC family protein [Lelliottia]|uniref:Virulence effector SrfC n=1 Tax=Lelliottia aquatilis TaxID=2080838 RepID=A0ABX5A7S1_9ENTR|nr:MULTISPECIES: virulence factor SrfC family protein [Lelliottia]NTZ44616.1 virulence effector SrfC [Lelliottia aquatilis]POZ27130.1 virulence effector SrfC [Lelliottia aquatilis]POZ33883.1 virulence effector SrfC [Lelliottia aquatilis]POZ34417.1 virulence effector SrfC [Lelliottia sp. 7254-16]POZ34951.1 virulence effector SrfC [Lelliottia aquatilis]
MTAMTATTQALIEWINETRLHAPMLDNDADALLAQLTCAQARGQAIDRALSGRSSIGLYGHSQAAKAHLLASLCGSGNSRLDVSPGQRTFDYFSHINPGHALTNMAVRFTPRASDVSDDAFPLRLSLVTEAELVQLFIARTTLHTLIRPVEKSVIESRVEKWRALRQPQAVPGITAQEVATIGRYWRSAVPGFEQQMDDVLWHQFAQLIPSLDLSTRASVWSLLWGEQQEITQQWLKLAHVLHQTSHARELAAPLSLLVDNFGLPSEGFLTRAEFTAPDAQEAVLHPLNDGEMLNAISIPVDVLAFLTRELVLPAENGVLDSVDIIDIPAPSDANLSPLAEAKCTWLLEHYRQQMQPDVLVICNATARHEQTAKTAKTLLNWVKETQTAEESALPGLVWAITPHDARFHTKQNLDEAVQHLLGKPGQRWGTLQALDTHSMQRVVEWLSQATLSTQRQSRLLALKTAQKRELHALMQSYLAPIAVEPGTQRTQAEAMVRSLQSSAARHGELLEGLLPPLKAFETLLAVQQPREEQVNGLFTDVIDLFADNASDGHETFQTKDKARLAHRVWLNHLRQWSRNEATAHRLGLDISVLPQIADALAISSYRLNLPQQLQRIVEADKSSAAQLHAAIGNFIGWLGYAETPVASRPASRVRKGQAIFVTPVVSSTTPRLTRLGEQPVHAATVYVYDWLVALYTRAIENMGFQHPHDIQPVARQALQTILR